jgi:nitrate/nitrite-specific signal transduction histidine kinase
MPSIEYIAGARLRHIDGTEATVNKTATTSDYVVSVEDDGGFDQLWPRDEIAGFGTITSSPQG